MLLELRAENYAVIDHAVAEFGPGLNLLTGETGAGKSILIDALVLLLGGKSSSDMVRFGAEKAALSCVFETTPGAEEILERNGIDAEGDEILLRREISSSGKGRVFINNQQATVGVLRQLSPELALVHAQSETMTAFDQLQQRLLIDRFAALPLDAVAAAFMAWRRLRAEIDELEGAEQDRLRQADLWSFQAKEIGDAAISDPEEDAKLEAEKRVLANSEKLFAAATAAQEMLYEAETSAASLLGSALRQVEELARFDPAFSETATQVATARASVEDAAATLRHFAGNVTASPERLEEVEERLVALDRLKRKYGSLPQVIAYGEEAARKLAELENRDATLADLNGQLERAAAAYRKVARELSAERAAAAAKLAKTAERRINELAMQARFTIAVLPDDAMTAWTPAGWDRVECAIATNPGEPLKPLTDIASGGEMSRVMLALKVSVEEGATAVAGKRKGTMLPRTLVFDEIDIGIGGRAAEAVGQKLKQLSRAQQVICITHLPQIAAFADQHFLIEKSEKRGRIQTGVRLMETGERVEEIARMLSGATLTETSMRHAEQMLTASR